MIACESLGLERRAGKSSRSVLANVCLSVEAGEPVLLGGPSGSGKSTLLALIGGLLRPTEGQVTVDGEPISRFAAPFRDRYRRTVGFLPQRLLLLEGVTAIESITLASFARGMSAHDGQESGRRLLSELRLSARADSPIEALSGGEQQRVALARALVGSPRTVLLDEPTSHQDDALVETVAALIRSHAHKSHMVVATHDPRLVDAFAGAPRYEVRNGTLERVGERLC